MDSTAIATTMPPGRYGARHIARWSVSVASCEATICCHRACSRAVSGRRTPWSSPSPWCETQHKTQLLASVYRTFYLAKYCRTRCLTKLPATFLLNSFLSKLAPLTNCITDSVSSFNSALESGIYVVGGASFDKKEFKRNVAGSFVRQRVLR